LEVTTILREGGEASAPRKITYDVLREPDFFMRLEGGTLPIGGKETSDLKKREKKATPQFSSLAGLSKPYSSGKRSFSFMTSGLDVTGGDGKSVGTAS